MLVDTAGAPARQIPLQQVFNFRDLGGYPTRSGERVRWRRVFRADGLNRLLPTDDDVVGELGLRTVVDLRTAAEVAERGRFPVERHGVDWHHLPMLDVTWSEEEDPDSEPPADYVARRYVEMLDTGAPAVADALGVLADDGAHAVVFHCAAGKDRTGILAAVLLGVLGVPDDVIVEDYTASAAAMVQMVAWMRATYPDMGADPTPLQAAMLGADAPAMEHLLATLRQRHGSPEGYARHAGVDGATLDALRASLLEA
jgi:protein-tyrosine phosphatase